MALRSYSRPYRAARTLRRLRERFPGHRFEVVESTLAACAFRYVIRCVSPDGRVAFVERSRF